jgi:hypothetical protein
MKIQVLWNVTPCLRYDGALCIHLQYKTDCLILKMKILSSSKMSLNIYQSSCPNGKRFDSLTMKESTPIIRNISTCYQLIWRSIPEDFNTNYSLIYCMGESPWRQRSRGKDTIKFGHYKIKFKASSLSLKKRTGGGHFKHHNGPPNSIKA